MNKKLALIGIVCFIVGIAIGYNVGFISALRFGVEIGVHFLELKGINLGINSGMIATALYQYRHQVGGCLFTEEEKINLTNGTYYYKGWTIK